MSRQDEIERLKQAIAAQEALRGILPDEQLEATFPERTPVRSRRDSLSGVRGVPVQASPETPKALYFRRKLHTLLAAYARGEATLEQVTASVQGWVNHVHHYGNTVGLRKAVLGQVVPSRRM